MDKKTLKKRLDEIVQIKYYEPERVMKLCRQLISQGKKEKDDVACAYGEYYLMEAKYRLGAFNGQIVKKAIWIMQLAKRSGQHDLECRCYNLLGIFLLNQGDMIAAMEYYQKGMELAKKYHYSSMDRILSNNIGDIYLCMKDYPKALSYLEKTRQQVDTLVKRQKETGTEPVHIYNSYVSLLNISILNISKVYYLLGNYEEGLRYISLLKEEEGLNGQLFYSYTINCMLAMNYGKLGRMEECRKYTELVIENIGTCCEKAEAGNDYIGVCSMLVECKEYASAKKLLDLVEKLIMEREFVNLWCDYYEVRIRYEKACAPENLLASYEAYFSCKKQQERIMESQQLKTIENRRILNEAIRHSEQVEVRNKQLKLLSEHDALTGLYNRYALNVECEKWSGRAKETQTTCGIIIMDVDYFKEYNDTYGHLQGDNCLKAVGEILREATEPDDFAVRYGGDEFFVLLRGKTDEEMLECAKRISDGIVKRKIVHEASKISGYVTLSLGISNCVLKEGQSIFDLIHFADNALYKVKEQSRGSIGIFNSDGTYCVYDKQELLEAIE